MSKVRTVAMMSAVAMVFPALAAAVPSWYDDPGGGLYDNYLASQGDANHDGVVDLSDLVVIKQNYGATGDAWITGDLTGDGWVQLDDFVVFKQHFGTVVGEPDLRIIPEPLSVITVAAGFAAVAGYARKRGRT